MIQTAFFQPQPAGRGLKIPCHSFPTFPSLASAKILGECKLFTLFLFLQVTVLTLTDQKDLIRLGLTVPEAGQRSSTLFDRARLVKP